MSMVSDLSSERGRQWSRRVPSVVIVLGPLVVAGFYLASVWNEPGGLSGDIEQVTSWGEMLFGIPIGVALGFLFLGWFAPRVGAWTMALTALPTILADNWLDEEPVWLIAVAAIWVVVVILDLVLLVRQRGRAFELQTLVPGSGLWRADHHLGARLVAGLVLVAGIVTALSFWVSWRSDMLELADRTVPVQAEVTHVDAFFDDVYAEVDGKEYEFAVNDADDHPVGSTINVFSDPTGKMRPFIDEDADPDGWSGIGLPIGAAVLLLALVVFEIGRRRRRAEVLAAEGGLTMNVLVRGHPVHDGLEVFATDDRTAALPLFFLPKVEVMVPADGSEKGGLRGAVRDLAGFARFVTRGEVDEEWDRPVTLHEDVCRATVVGLVGDGSICVLRLRDGGEELVLASVRPARDSWTVRTIWMAALRRAMPGKGRRVRDNNAPARERAESAEAEEIASWIIPVLRLGHRLASVGPVLLAALGAVAMPWLLEDEGFGFTSVVSGFLVAGFAVRWWDLGRPRTMPSRWGLRVTDTWFDVLVVPGDASRAVRLDNSVVVEGSEDGEVVFDFGPLPYLDGADQQQELNRVAGDFNALSTGSDRYETWGERWPRHLPSSATLVGAVTFCCWAFSTLV